MPAHSKILFVAVALILFGTSLAFSQKTYSLKSHKASVDGTSTLHDWSTDVSKLEWSGQLTVEGTSVKAIQNVSVTNPVE